MVFIVNVLAKGLAVSLAMSFVIRTSHCFSRDNFIFNYFLGFLNPEHGMSVYFSSAMQNYFYSIFLFFC